MLSKATKRRKMRNKKEEKMHRNPVLGTDIQYSWTYTCQDMLRCGTSLGKLKAIYKRTMFDFLPAFEIGEELITSTTYFLKSLIDFHYWFLSNSAVFNQYLIRSRVWISKYNIRYIVAWDVYEMYYKPYLANMSTIV